MLTVETPTSTRLRDVIDTLCMGRDCAVDIAPAHPPAATDYVSVYRTMDGSPAAAWVLPISTAAHIAAAMGGFPRTRAQECAQAGLIDTSLLEALVEVGNVLGVLVNGPGSERLRFSGVSLASNLPRDVQGLFEAAGRRAGFSVSIDGDGPRISTVVLAA